MNSVVLTVALAGVLVSSSQIYPSTIKDKKDLGLWLKDNFTYQKEEKGDHWKTPEETIKDKQGDCEDFAVLVNYVLKDLGYDSKLLIVKNKGSKTSHAICLVKNKDGTFEYFSNTRYNFDKEVSITALLNKNYPKWKYVRGFTPDRKFGKRIRRKRR